MDEKTIAFLEQLQTKLGQTGTAAFEALVRYEVADAWAALGVLALFALGMAAIAALCLVLVVKARDEDAIIGVIIFGGLAFLLAIGAASQIPIIAEPRGYVAKQIIERVK